ncbi:MAG TPA: Fic family protein [Candidatus Acidoferrales bacterium]|nr:Fic family protein [Candidatus Acidoferrales bacterium]
MKRWNWEQADWPNFSHDAAKLVPLEHQFLHQAGILTGAIKHIGTEDRNALTIQLISNEALKTSEIEGEILNRESLQSSIRRNFGLATDDRKTSPAEQGIAEMMADLYHHFATPLTDESLFGWHGMLMQGRRDMKEIGAYRTDETAMQVVSGAIHAPKVHFEAPPAKALAKEMKRFIAWFNETAPDGKQPLPPLTRAGIAHLYFVSIHPFEDGNGRIGRAISEKALSQALKQPTLIALSQVINSRRKAYYDWLEKSNRRNEITGWLSYFAETILEGQVFTQKMIDLLITKAKFFDRFKEQLNLRQEKVISRMFREEPEGFKGGLSAENYIHIAKTSRATATRDLQDLVQINALKRTGNLKSTRYYLNLNLVQ